MNDQKFVKKVEQDVDKVKKDIRNLVGDGVNQFEDKFEKLTDDAKEILVSTASSLKKDVGYGLSQYNTKAQEYAEKIPGGVAEKASQYPWVAISIGLLIGLLVGGLLKPSRR